MPSSPLAIRDFQLFWIARFCAVLATMGMVVIIGYQVYDVARAQYGMSIREASFVLGLLGAVQFVPLAILTPVAGWAADRYERRTVARLANSMDAGIALALALATYNGWLSLPLLFTLAALHGVARVFTGPSMSAIAPNIVPPELLPKAIALSSIAWQGATVAGPAIGGFLYAAHPSAPYWTAAALMCLAILALTPIRRIVPPQMEGHPHPIRQMIEGLTYVRGHRFLLGAITLDLFAVLLGGATAMLPVFARDILQVGTEGLGLLRAAPAVGAALVAAVFAVRPLKQNVGVKMLWAVAAFGLTTVVFGLSRSLPLSLLVLASLGAADMLSVYVRSSLVQLHTPDTMRGRVSAVSGLAISASNELGELQSGLFAALLGPVGAVVFGGGAAIAVAGAWSQLFPELRRARTFDPPPEVLARAVEEEKPA
ncbi:MFS transporter [Sphingomonas sp. BN140010]|uniref:MFS transporter n=1 Tax=Sphingomonas arvum TaxID=2992113 RepID=A0ABT3JCL2_9SPHN|nr:MFS transporter [Sphingomonas sp. BN140010]MCW3796805.1 MFS transporter [Sphingomonas sp. BN140010]